MSNSTNMKRTLRQRREAPAKPSPEFTLLLFLASILCSNFFHSVTLIPFMSFLIPKHLCLKWQRSTMSSVTF